MDLNNLYHVQKLSIPQISKILKLSLSTTRREILKRGIKLRTQHEGIKLAIDRMSSAHKGRRWKMSKQGKKNISMSRINNENFKGFRKNTNGYLEFTRGRLTGKLVHRHLIEKKISRRLKVNEMVHHKDHNRLNNNIENLEILTRKKHSSLHAKENTPLRKRNSSGQFTKDKLCHSVVLP